MERFVKGEVVVVNFPFSNLASSKKRPALVLADLIGNDVILCQITSKTVKDIYSIPLLQSDFDYGNLHKTSNICPNKLFTADKNIIIKKIGTISTKKLAEAVEKIFELLN